MRTFSGTLVTWFQSDGSLQRIEQTPWEWGIAMWGQRDPKVLPLQDATYMALSWTMGCCKWDSPIDWHYATSRFSDLKQKSTARWPSCEHYLREMAVRAVAPVDHYERLRKTTNRHCRGEPSLTGDHWRGVPWRRAQSAFFNILRTENGELITNDEQHKPTDRLMFDEGEPNMKSRLPELAAGEEHVRREFIALSISIRDHTGGTKNSASNECMDPMLNLNTWTQDFKWHMLSEKNFTFFYDESVSIRPSLVKAMLIGRDDDGFAVRMGLGEIFLTKWAKAERRFTDIALR